MNYKLWKTTLLALVLVAERVSDALDNDDLHEAVRESVLLELGAHLLTLSIAKNADFSADKLEALRAKYRSKIDEQPDAQTFVINADRAKDFLAQKRKANEN